MSGSAGFNIEDLINRSSLKGGGEMRELKVEQLMSKLRRLQQGIRDLEEEIKAVKSVCDSLQKELATSNNPLNLDPNSSVQAEAYDLEGQQKEKEALCRKLQFQWDEYEQDAARQLEQRKKSDELLEQYRCEIQEFKLKQRKQRMKFEHQLNLLIEGHKNLHSVFAPERLPGEIESAEKTNHQLLTAEQLKLAQLHGLDETIEEVRTQKQPMATPAESQEQNVCL